MTPEANKITLRDVTTHQLTSVIRLYIVIFQFNTNSTLLHKYRRFLKLKVGVLVEQMLRGHARWFYEFGYAGSVSGRKKLPG